MSFAVPVRWWRRAVVAATVVATTASAALYANLHYSSDLYWLLAAGRHLVRDGATEFDPFRTLNEGERWHNQQWLTEVIFYALWRHLGFTGLSLVYALVLGLAALPLVLACRGRRQREAAVAGALMLGAALVAVVDPRAAGISLLAFCCLLVLTSGERRRWRTWLIPVLFVAWANFHGAFLVGFLFLALVAAGSYVDARRGVGEPLLPPRLLLFAAALPAVLVTPLGADVFAYLQILSSHPLLPGLTFEWDPTFEHPYLLGYTAAFVAFAGWLWRRAARPRPLEPLVVAVGFAVLSLTATRQLLWLGPVAFYLLRRLGAAGELGFPRRVGIPLLAAASAALAAWLLFVRAPPNEEKMRSRTADWVAAHPPTGRVAVAAGTGSYRLWRAPSVPITVDGRYENYSSRELEGSYDIVAHRDDAERLVEAWRIGGIITRNPRAAAEWRRTGLFRVAHVGEDGIYLVRRGV